MGNRHDVAEKLKMKIRDYISEKDKVSFGDLREEFCNKRKLMSNRTFVKYLTELVDEDKISRMRDIKSQRFFYSESPYNRWIDMINKLHYDYLKSIKTLEEAKRYCEILWLMKNRASRRKPKSEIIEIDINKITK